MKTLLLLLMLSLLLSCSKEPMMDCDCGTVYAFDTVYVNGRDQRHVLMYGICDSTRIRMVLCKTYDESGLNYQVGDTICY